MSLAIGSQLGPYQILASIGAGGMGEVFRARDTKLNRDVAVKVIPEIFATDPDRLARFEREAQALAALNHPNIAQVYGLERQQFSFIVMELVDGEELAQRIARGPLPLDEAMPIAAQIAEALEAAHEQGIIHRDLKPANIKIRNDGTVKVLDFGLAKAMDATATSRSNASISPTLSLHATQAGIILGTAAYMSPEQARGRPVDKRADIWAFGVVFYEMVTGRKPFLGDDVGEMLAAVIKEQPSWDAVPAQLRRLLQRCLEKDPKKRLRDISGVALLLEEPPATARPRAPRLPWIAAGVLAVAAGVAAWAPWRSAPIESRPLVRLDVDLGADMVLGSPQGADVILSPDGSRLVWVSRNRLFTRRLDQPKATELVTSTGSTAAFAPFFSPDGRWVAFFTLGALMKVSVDGGATVTLCPAGQGRGGSWGEDGRIVASLDGISLSTIPDTGGTPTTLTEAGPGGAVRWPQILPGARAVLFTARTGGSYDDANIEVLSIPDRRRQVLQRGGTFGRYVANANGGGHLVYINKGTLFAAPFDANRLEVRGTPSPVLENVGYAASSGTAQFDVSRNGTSVYRSASSPLVALQWLDSKGNTQPISTKPGGYAQPRLSPDGKLLALAMSGSGGQDIWVLDLQRDAMWPLTFGGGTYTFPVWSPDGRYIVFTGGFGSGGTLWTRSDGAGKPQPFTQSKGAAQFPWSFSPDGKRLAFAEFQGAAGGDIWTVPVESDANAIRAGKPEVFLQTPASELYPAFSPDGRWIAYRTFESGTSEIQVRPFPVRDGKWLISTGGGIVPVWSPTGRELFYRTADQRIMVLSYTVTGDAFVADKPRLWSERRLADVLFRNLDIALDGTRFVAMMPVDSREQREPQNQVVFLQNFSDELRRRVGAANQR